MAVKQTTEALVGAAAYGALGEGIDQSARARGRRKTGYQIKRRPSRMMVKARAAVKARTGWWMSDLKTH
jgi:hypothetical protein